MTRNLQGVGIFLLISAAFFSYEIFIDEKIVLPSVLDFSFKPSFLVGTGSFLYDEFCSF